ncbi:MAG TPA: hypothetical protein DHV28_07880 [Ignavibacteriales bacterium]|nr:hypothetical protein [Ignavibacteriales bacterium]
MFMKLTIKILSILFFLTAAKAQVKDTLYSISADAGIGYSRYLTTLQFKDLNKNGVSGTLRLMWHPEHLLSIGVETGYQYLYSIKSEIYSDEFGTSSISASMISVPLLFVASMIIFPKTLPNFELNGGGGVYFLFNHGELYESSIESSVFSLGYHFGASYLAPVNDNLSIGGEIKYFYMSKLQDSNLLFQILFSYKMITW